MAPDIKSEGIQLSVPPAPSLAHEGNTLNIIGHALDRSIFRLNHGFGIFSTILLILLGVFVCVNLVGRWTGFNLSWGFSGSIVALIGFTFLMSGYALGEGKHIAVDIILTRLSKNGRIIMEIFGYFVCLVFCVVLGFESVRWVAMDIAMGTTTESISFATLPILPMWTIEIVVPIGSLLLVLQSLRLIVKGAYQLTRQTIRFKIDVFPTVLGLAVFIICILLAIYVNPLVGLFLALIALLLIGAPIGFGLGFIGAIGLYLFVRGNLGLGQVPIKAFSAVESFPAVAMPLFVLIGPIFERAGWANACASFVTAWFYRLRGSILMMSIVGGIIMSALTSSAVAATALLGMIFIPVLFERGYDKRLSCGTVLGAGMGCLIPPSGSLILYGILTEISIGKLFIAVLGPAFILFAMEGIYILILSYTNKSKFGKPMVASTWTEKSTSLTHALPILFFPVFILGGIYGGIFSATEAAGAALIYGFIITLAFARKLSLRGIWQACVDGSLMSSMILYMLVGGILFGAVVTQLRVGPAMTEWAAAIGLDRFGVVVFMFVVLLILGMFMDSAAMLMVTIPLFYPLAMSVRIDPLWLGVFFTMMLELGLLTPPVGLNLFVVMEIGHVSFKDVLVGATPFMFMIIATVFIMYFLPGSATWLPSMMVGGG